MKGGHNEKNNGIRVNSAPVGGFQHRMHNKGNCSATCTPTQDMDSRTLYPARGMDTGTLEVRKMKSGKPGNKYGRTIWPAIFIMACITISSAASAFSADSGNLKEKLTTLRNWQLMEEFDLSPERAQKVFSILSRFDDRRVELLTSRRRIIDQLRKNVREGNNAPERLNRLMEDLSKTNVQLARLPEKERKALSGLFSPVEQARYLLFSENFARNLRKILINNRRGGGPARRY